MSVEKESEQQKKTQEQTLKECQESMKQRTAQNEEDLKKKITQEYDKQCQNLSKQYEKTKKMFTDVVDSFSTVVTGYQNPADVDIDTIIAPLQAAFEPIVELLGELHIDIPGLSMIMQVLSAAKDANKKAKSASKKVKDANKKAKSASKKVKDATSKAKSELTSKDRNTSKGLQNTSTTIMISVSMLFINLLIGMVAKILELLMELLDTIVDSDNLPYPLNLIPKALKALPKIISLAMNLPTQLGMICDAVCIKYNDLISDAKDATDADDVSIPDPYMPCPEKEVKLLSDKIVDKAASQAKQYVPPIPVK